MRTIICKKCGAQIDATLGECPNCGAVYYILPEEDKTLEWAMSMDTDTDNTQVFNNKENAQTHGASVHSTSELLNADNDELFSTRVWKANEDTDITKAIKISATDKPKAAQVPPVTRPNVQRPVRQNTPNSGHPVKNGKQPADKAKDARKKQLVVAAVALLAVLTLVLTIMGGAFDFGKSDDKNEMPRVVGFTQETAITILEAMGLEVTTMNEENEAVAGTVIEQSLKEGRKVKKGDSVTLIVSTGKAVEETENAEYIEVPSLEGKTYDQAKQALETLGLKITKAEDTFSEEEAGKIISQSPLKGAKIEKGDLVTVTLSKGPEPSPSPTGHTITVTAGKGGTISPKGIVTVEDGKDQIFTITPDKGYEIREVKVDGTSIGAVTSYPFTKVTSDHSIYVVFKLKDTTTSPSPSASPTPTPATNTDITNG